MLSSQQTGEIKKTNKSNFECFSNQIETLRSFES